MHYGVILRVDGTFYISDVGSSEAFLALSHAEGLLNHNDIGVLGTFYVTSLHAEHPCVTSAPTGKFLKLDSAQNWL